MTTDVQFKLDLRMVAHANSFIDDRCEVSRCGNVEAIKGGLVAIRLAQQGSDWPKLRLVINNGQARRLGQLLLLFAGEQS